MAFSQDDPLFQWWIENSSDQMYVDIIQTLANITECDTNRINVFPYIGAPNIEKIKRKIKRKKRYIEEI